MSCLVQLRQKFDQELQALRRARETDIAESERALATAKSQWEALHIAEVSALKEAVEVCELVWVGGGVEKYSVLR